MGLYDNFIPDPPINCLTCGGSLSAWQGKPSSGSALFVWKQGIPHPINQNCDEGVRLAEEKRNDLRLPKTFCLYGATCKDCGYCFPGSKVVGYCEHGVWAKTIVEPAHTASLVEENWIRCYNCENIWESVQAKTHDICPDCQNIVRIKW